MHPQLKTAKPGRLTEKALRAMRPGDVLSDDIVTGLRARRQRHAVVFEFRYRALRLVPDAGDSTCLAALGADWWGRCGEGAFDWLARANPINVALPTGEVLTIRADERGIGLAVCMEEAPAQAASGASWEEHSWSVATKRSNNNARLRW